MKEYKFLDIGCKNGSSWGIAKSFGYEPSDGLGIDINPDYVDAMKELNYDAELGDATNLRFKDGEFELSIISHVLEHMPSEKEFDKALHEAIRVSNKWVFISYPLFDYDIYLKLLGLKVFYSDWRGHTCKVNLKDLKEKLKDYHYEVNMIKLLKDSTCSEIHPVSSPIDQLDYDPAIHPPKHRIVFNLPVYREFTLVIDKIK